MNGQMPWVGAVLVPADRRHSPLALPLAATWDKLVEPPKAAASVTVPDVIQAATEAHPHSDAFAAVGVEEEYTWDFPTLRYITRGFGAGLVDLGHKHGSKYMTWGECGPEMVGCLRLQVFRSLQHLTTLHSSASQAALALAGSHVGAINVGMPAEASVEDVARAVQSLGVRSLYFQERLGQLDAFSGLVDQFAPRAHNSKHQLDVQLARVILTAVDSCCFLQVEKSTGLTRNDSAP